MRKDYRLKDHLRSYIKQELYDFNKNKQILEDLQKKLNSQLINTKSLLILTKQINSIQNVYDSLIPEEQELFDIIFNKGCNQLYAKSYFNVTKDMYYNAMNKIIYLTAQEYELI